MHLCSQACLIIHLNYIWSCFSIFDLLCERYGYCKLINTNGLPVALKPQIFMTLCKPIWRTELETHYIMSVLMPSISIFWEEKKGYSSFSFSSPKTDFDPSPHIEKRKHVHIIHLIYSTSQKTIEFSFRLPTGQCHSADIEIRNNINRYKVKRVHVDDACTIEKPKPRFQRQNSPYCFGLCLTFATVALCSHIVFLLWSPWWIQWRPGTQQPPSEIMNYDAIVRVFNTLLDWLNLSTYQPEWPSMKCLLLYNKPDVLGRIKGCGFHFETSSHYLNIHPEKAEI